MNKSLKAAVAGFAMAAAMAGGVALAQPGPGSGYGPGGPGAGGPGYGWGAGMMGGYGQGMMRGYGGPSGQRWGRGGSGPERMLASLNLTEEQQGKVAKIQEENRSKNWSAMGEMQSEMFKLRQMYFGNKLDANAVSEQQRKVDELRRQMLKSHVETRNQIEVLLTPEQRQQFRSFGPWWHEVD